MNLIDGAPQSVEISGKMWRIRSDFRVFLLLEEMLGSPALTDPQKTALALRYFYPEIPPDMDGAVEKMRWFYHCGQPDEGQDSAKKSSVKPLYSFRQDANALYAAFWERYRIDLLTDTVHWWKFNALLTTLVSGVDFSEIVKCRAVKISRGMSKEQAAYYRSMKRAFALKEDSESVGKIPKSQENFKNSALKKSQRRRQELQQKLKEKPPG